MRRKGWEINGEGRKEMERAGTRWKEMQTRSSLYLRKKERRYWSKEVETAGKQYKMKEFNGSNL